MNRYAQCFISKNWLVNALIWFNKLSNIKPTLFIFVWIKKIINYSDSFSVFLRLLKLRTKLCFNFKFHTISVENYHGFEFNVFFFLIRKLQHFFSKKKSKKTYLYGMLSTEPHIGQARLSNLHIMHGKRRVLNVKAFLLANIISLGKVLCCRQQRRRLILTLCITKTKRMHLICKKNTWMS